MQRVDYVPCVMADVQKVSGLLYSEAEIKALADEFKSLKDKTSVLEKELHTAESFELEKQGSHANTTIKDLMNAIRELADEFEKTVPKDLWPYPSYADLLHTH